MAGVEVFGGGVLLMPYMGRSIFMYLQDTASYYNRLTLPYKRLSWLVEPQDN